MALFFTTVGGTCVINIIRTRWNGGPMHWGHAVSRDLVTWEHWPIALEPDERGAI
jgi:sucrose-6-phosphate hydrolase SacC (GH32 family)